MGNIADIPKFCDFTALKSLQCPNFFNFYENQVPMIDLHCLESTPALATWPLSLKMANAAVEQGALGRRRTAASVSRAGSRGVLRREDADGNTNAYHPKTDDIGAPVIIALLGV